jgi:hypothetical protein
MMRMEIRVAQGLSVTRKDGQRKVEREEESELGGRSKLNAKNASYLYTYL